MPIILNYLHSYMVFILQAKGGFIMSASHNPGGPENDWGIKVSIYMLIIMEHSIIFPSSLQREYLKYNHLVVDQNMIVVMW